MLAAASSEPDQRFPFTQPLLQPVLQLQLSSFTPAPIAPTLAWPKYPHARKSRCSDSLLLKGKQGFDILQKLRNLAKSDRNSGFRSKIGSLGSRWQQQDQPLWANLCSGAGDAFASFDLR